MPTNPIFPTLDGEPREPDTIQLDAVRRLAKEAKA